MQTVFRKMSDKATKTLKTKKTKPLPWWVELLFVQIGLPDALLRWFLRYRKTAGLFVDQHRKPIGVSIIGLLTLIYLYPPIKKADNHNKCVDVAKQYVINKIPSEVEVNKKSITAWSSRYCNGGDV